MLTVWHITSHSDISIVYILIWLWHILPFFLLFVCVSPRSLCSCLCILLFPHIHNEMKWTFMHWISRHIQECFRHISFWQHIFLLYLFLFQYWLLFFHPFVLSLLTHFYLVERTLRHLIFRLNSGYSCISHQRNMLKNPFMDCHIMS